MNRTMIDYLRVILEKGGYRTEISHEMTKLMEALLLLDGKKSGNPEFDPALHDLHADNSLWIKVRDKGNEIIATSAARLVDTHDFIGLTRSYKLWYGDKIRFMDPLKIVVGHNVTIPCGQLVFDGAMWVRRDHRRRGLSWILARLLKAVTFESWNPDWYFGMAFQAIANTRLPIYGYGYETLEPFATGYHFPGYAPHDLSLATLSRAQYLEHSTKDLALLTTSPELSIGSEFAMRIRAGKREVPVLPEYETEQSGTFGIAR